MKSKKPIVVLLIALTILSLACGIVGFLESRKNNEKEPTEVKYNVMYKYYLNEIEVEQMPTNPTLVSSSTSASETSVEKLYAFNTASCTNKVTYKWDEATWTFTPSNTADSTCKIYFVTTYNTIEVKATNGTVTPLASNKIKRGEDAIIKITPTDGYEYEKTTCSNNEVVEWNKDKQELTVKSISAETTCDVVFKISKFTVEIKVNNGTGSTKVEYDYGKKVEINVAAATGYGTPTISCTNNQTGEWKNEIYTIEKLTNETVCTIDFKQIQTNTSFTVTLDPGNHGILASGTPTVTVVRGSYATFNINVDDGWEIDQIQCTDGVVSKSGNIVTVRNIIQNTECSIIYKENNA